MNINNARRIPYILDRLQEMEDSPATAITDGIVVTQMGNDYLPIKAEVYGEHIPPRIFRSFYHNGLYDGCWWKCEELTFKNVKYIHNSACSTMQALKNVNTNTAINIASYSFADDTSLETVIMPNVELMNLDENHDYTDSNYTGGEFYNCTNLKAVVAPKLKNINRGTFGGCTALKTISLPSCTYVNSRGLANNISAFGSCTALETVEIGSVDNGVTYIHNGAFYNCTQSGLTITVYTTGAYADTALINIRNGATNATIKIYAAEDTTYDGDSYAAGELLLTSEV